jgi:hypothetical protein
MEGKDLRKAGLKVTLPRLKILEILERSATRHLSAEEIYKSLIGSSEDIGLATVYRVTGLDPARFAHQTPRSRHDLQLAMWSNTASERKITSAAEIFFVPRSDDVKKNGRTSSRSAAVNSTYRRQKMRRHLPPNYRLRLIVS